MKCIVCESETTKYKCPKCFDYYCSLDCSKKHKEIGCESKKTPQDEAKEKPPPAIPVPFRTEDTVDPSKLEELRNSKQLKDLLRNPHLRNYLKEIDEAPGAWKAMKVAMQEPLFIEFADECLKIVEPPISAEDEENYYF